MKSKVSKWGNSMGIRLPKFVVEQLDINTNNELELSIEGDTLVIKKKSELDKMLGKVTKKNTHSEVFTDTPMGKEIW